MFNRSGTVEIVCDAPPYSIVQACSVVGVRDPEDVRWCQLSRFRHARHVRPELFNLRSWKAFLGMKTESADACSCRHALPRLEEYTFTYSTGAEVRYLIGQCARCRTVFWDEP
jgi:hypothetical protein